VLVPVTYGFSVRYLLPTGLLGRLTDFCDPVVALSWDDPELVRRVEALGIDCVALPAPELTHRYRMYRRRVAVVHERRLQSPTTAIQRANRLVSWPSRRVRAITEGRRLVDRVVTARPGGAAAVEAAEDEQLLAGTNVADFDGVVEATGVEAVVSVTPYHDADALLLWAARRRGLPTVTAVISFDNPTTRERLVVRGDRVLVWNRHNAAELVRSYPDLPPSRVRVVGAPQFDLHRRADLVLDEATWRNRLGLPADRPVVHYGGISASQAPGEVALVELLDRAVEDGRIPGRPVLLVRHHPTDDPAPWRALAARLRHGVVVDPWHAGPTVMTGWPTDEEVALQMSTFAHAAAHVSICSSLAIDGAAFDRPHVCPTFVPGHRPDEARRLRALYDQEHWQPIRRSGGVVEVGDEAELLAAVADGLAHPERGRGGRRRLVEDLVTYTDGRSSERFVAEVAELLRSAGRLPVTRR
jgi:hypothetical protein